jgi:Fic family protein
LEEIENVNNPINNLDSRKSRIDAMRPLSAAALSRLNETLSLEYTYNSNGIEGNTLTLRETKIVLEGITIGGHSVREHLEAINHAEAIEYMISLANKNTPIDDQSIRGIHSIILSKIDREVAGIYRRINVEISGAEHVPPKAILVPDKMKDFITWANSDAQDLHPIERAAIVHTDFVNIHPFVDGNGRTARLLMNLELVKSGYPITIIEIQDRPQYYESLDRAALDGDYKHIIEVVSTALARSFDRYEMALGISHSQGDDGIGF